MSQTPNDPSPIDPVNNDAVNGQNPQGSVPNYTPPAESGFPPPPAGVTPPAAGATPPAGAYPPPSEGGFPPPPPVPGQQYGAPGQQYGAPGQQYAYQQPVAQAPNVGEAFNWGWLKFTQNIGPMLLGVLALMVPTAIGGILMAVGISSSVNSQLYYGGSGAGGTFIMFLGIIVMILGIFLVQLGIYRASLDISQGRTVTFGTFFSFQDVGKVLVAAILLGVITMVASLLTFFLGGLGGVVFMFFAQFTLLFVLDKSLSPIDAIKASMSLVNKNLGTVVILYLAVGVASFVGALFLGLGLLVALPVSMLATAYMYRKLQGEPVAA